MDDEDSILWNVSTIYYHFIDLDRLDMTGNYNCCIYRSLYYYERTPEGWSI